MLDLLDELGIADDTFVQYSTDNGPHRNTWPDGGMTPFRSEKNTNWEGAFRIPLLVRWPGKVEAGLGRQRHRPAPRLAADLPRRWPARRTSSTSSRRATRRSAAPTRTTSTASTCCRTSPARRRRARATSSSTSATTATCSAMRYDNWKLVFMEQRCHGTMQVWAEPFTRLRLPKIFNLRTDPYEFADDHVEHLLRLVPPQRLLHLRGAGGRGEVRRDVQGLPAGPEARQLHHRRRDREDGRGRRPGQLSGDARLCRRGTTARRSRRSSTSSRA